MDCPLKKNDRCREVAVVERCPLEEVRLNAIYVVLKLKSIFLSIISTRKEKRSVSKQVEPHCLSLTLT